MENEVINDPGEVQRQADAAQAAKNSAAYSDGQSKALSNSLSGPGGGITLQGSKEQVGGALQGLQFGQMLYGQGIGDVGKEAADYSGMVKGRLGADYAKADIQRQEGGQRIAQANVKAGLSGVDTTGVNEQARRQGAMGAAAMNQDYQDKALALYGRNIGAKQQGLAGQYQAGAGIGAAATPGATANYSSGALPGSIICTELYIQGKITRQEWLRASVFGYNIHPNEYLGYLTIAKPIVKLMRKSDKLSNLLIGWAKSISNHKPNLLTRILLPLCWSIGYVRKIKEKKITRIA